MHVLEKAFIDLLRNHLTLTNDKIYAGSRYIPRDITPCVTVVLADESFIKRDYIEINNIQNIRKRYNAELWINIWCNTEEERQSLIDEITLRINQAEANHYTTCTYHSQENKCNKTMNDCEALTSQNGRANKKQCPHPDNYESFFKRNNIPKRTFNINSITDLDELDTSETLLRTIFRLNMNFYSFYPIGGRLFNSIDISEDLL